MKFTRNDAANQRIERITNHHAIVGIDIAKDIHAAQITDFRGRTLTPRHVSFTNTKTGFEKLLTWIQAVGDKHGKTSFLVGMEPTGHYWHNLADWLLEQGLEVVLVNPVTTHRNKENRDNSPSKNDPKDALVIADVVSRGYYTDYSPQEPVFDQIKAVMSAREYWSGQSTSLGNRIVRWIDLYFPEFRHVFPEWDGVRALATLKAFALPAELRKLNAEEVVEGWRSQGMRRVAGASGKAKAVELLSAAARSIGKSNTNDAARQDILRLLHVYEETQLILTKMKQELETLLEQVPFVQQLYSLRGLGTITIASLLGCAGDLRHYAHGRQLLRRAGLNLAERTSGKHKGQIKLSKRGSSMLRKYLYLGVLGLVRQHPDFKYWHTRNQAKGMSRMYSIFKLMGKLARIIIGMIQRGETYQGQMPQAVAA
ncbi:transposase IS116/IS110/IS902 family protein [Paenibacillus curdlanolyticus YK9]|uniref:Transposase IS116/IS110/IS902 family protein n=1 Tax=Paenibacillus curdlanolyticus YK9 TaxID=717606 RepID=E0IFU9_9BACL|nr:IS110 family transposase [Paenibacillus curdlanolyticus]EFM08660.1 transposase IS116/IS110/IS902 family protein [Paenibacillus curdlanolyticus YK9]